MEPSLTDTLCTQCGLCCDGSLFADVELVGQPEAMRREIMGLGIVDEETEVGLLSHPCRALQGRRCSIYGHRPKCCRIFECQLLQDAQQGAVTPERATEQIAETFALIRRVRELLAELGQSDARMPLKKRCAEALAGEASASPEVNQKRADLAAAMSAVEQMIWQTFLGSGRPRGSAEKL